MERRRHPVKDEFYELLDDGTVQVSNEDCSLVGTFSPDGKWHGGNLKYADPHMVQWIGGQQASGTLSASAHEVSEDGQG